MDSSSEEWKTAPSPFGPQPTPSTADNNTIPQQLPTKTMTPSLPFSTKKNPKMEPGPSCAPSGTASKITT